MDTHGLATDTWAYGGDTFLHIRAIRSRHYDGTSTVRQYASEASVKAANSGSGIISNIGKDQDSKLAYEFFTFGGTEREKITYAKLFDKWDSAVAFAKRGEQFIEDGHGQGFSRRGSVFLTSDGKWYAKKVDVV
jgi:hypothetical protein